MTMHLSPPSGPEREFKLYFGNEVYIYVGIEPPTEFKVRAIIKNGGHGVVFNLLKPYSVDYLKGVNDENTR